MILSQDMNLTLETIKIIQHKFPWKQLFHDKKWRDKLIVGGYNTDDLTDRQNHVFRKLYNNPVANNNPLALNFLSYSVRKNFQCREFYNYEDDCDYLLKIEKETLIKYRIDLK